MILCTPVIRAIIAADELVLIGADRENPICSEEDSEKLAESVQKVMKFLDMTNGGAGGTAGKEEIPFELRRVASTLRCLLNERFSMMLTTRVSWS